MLCITYFPSESLYFPWLPILLVQSELSLCMCFVFQNWPNTKSPWLKKTILFDDDLKLIDNIYIYILSFIIFICLKWFELITQSIKYLTVNHVLMILMYIHKSCNNALLFSLIERTQNVKTNINDNSRSYPMIILAKQLQNIWDCVISSLESTFQNSVRPRNSSLFRVIIYFRGLKTR